MEQLDQLSMDMLRMSSHKVVDTLAHSQSTTNMSKSISGASLSSSQATQRTKCGSEFSSVGGSARFATLSSTPHSPGTDDASAADPASDLGTPRPAAPGGAKTVVGGVAPVMHGMLRRRARFSGWKAEQTYFEVRSTALLSFAGGSGGGGVGTGTKGKTSHAGSASGSGHHSFASFAAKIMHTNNRQAGEWSWSTDLAGAERLVELPALTKKGTYAFAVEFPPGSKKKTLVLAAPSAAARERWMAAMDRARHCVQPEDFQPLSVIGEGHFGKVLLVRWKNGAVGAATPTATAAVETPRSIIGDGSNAVLLPPLVAEEGEDGEADDSYSSSPQPDVGIGGRGGGASDRFLAVKEVALHKGTSLPGVLNERQILGVLREHPFVVTLRCAWRRGNFLYYGLDFLPGADLFELFRRNAIKMDLQAARVYGGQVALALEHLHAHGICYRDLKPENILVDAKGHLCLADMGLSKILGTGEDALRTTTVCGTRAYLAPEMVLHKPYGLSVDFWQFGCFIYELYAGHSPFWKPRSGPPKRAHDQTVALILAGEVHYPRSIDPTAKSLIRQLLQLEVGSRLGCGGNGSEQAEPASPTTVASQQSTPSVEPAADAAAAAAAGSEDAASSGPATAPSGEEEEARGWQSVKRHRFFRDMNWEALLRGDIPAPIRPGGVGRGMVGNFSREYTRQRAGWGGDQQELRDVTEKEGLFKRELMGFDFVRR